MEPQLTASCVRAGITSIQPPQYAWSHVLMGTTKMLAHELACNAQRGVSLALLQGLQAAPPVSHSTLPQHSINVRPVMDCATNAVGKATPTVMLVPPQSTQLRTLRSLVCLPAQTTQQTTTSMILFVSSAILFVRHALAQGVHSVLHAHQGNILWKAQQPVSQLALTMQAITILTTLSVGSAILSVPPVLEQLVLIVALVRLIDIQFKLHLEHVLPTVLTTLPTFTSMTQSASNVTQNVQPAMALRTITVIRV